MSEQTEPSSTQNQNAEKYPSAEFLYSVSLEDYNRVLSNYDRIYDRINIALALCGVILIVILSNVDMTAMFNWNNYTNLEKMAVGIYGLCAIGSAVLIVIAVIKLLLLSRSKEILSFDSNGIKTEALYNEKIEDAALWVILQYIRVINDIREKIKDKQKAFNTATIQIIIALLAYVVAMLIHNGGSI